MSGAKIPKFKDLPFIPGRTDERHAWDVWGRDDNLGSINRLGPEQVKAATKLVRTGEVITLTLPLNEPSPGLFPHRPRYDHVPHRTKNGRDDKVDNFYLQGSSQWDGMRHMRYREFYWGGRTDDDLDATTDIGIEAWSDHGIAGRGVLIDVVGYMEKTGRQMPFDKRFEITVELIEEIAADQGVTFEQGDILLVRAGWIEGYKNTTEEVREAMMGTVGSTFECPGLESSRQMAEWLWDTGISAVAADNPALEVQPVDREKGFLHRRVIALQGMAVGELWWLKDLADSCRASGNYDFMLVSAPLNIPGGIGSPSNAYAIV